MECAPHRIWKKLMALVLSLVLMAVMLPGALAVDLNVDAGFYFKQSRGGTCTLASAAMMLRYSFGLDEAADAVERAVNAFLDAGYRTPDISGSGSPEKVMDYQIVGTREAGQRIAEYL